MENRLPPQNLEYEQSILAGMMLSQGIGDDDLDLACNRLDVGDFYKSAHQKIFLAINSLRIEDTHITLETVVNKLREFSDLDAVGGVTYVSNIIDHAPVPGQMEYYINDLLWKSTLRIVINQCHNTIKAAYEARTAADADEVVSGLQAKALDAGVKSEVGMEENAYDVMTQMVDQTEQVHQQGGIKGISTGFKDLDNKLGGLRNGNLITLAGRPGMGKSALLMNFTRNLIMDGKRVGLFNLETSNISFATRLVACDASIDGMRMELGTMDQEQWNRFMESAGKFSKGWWSVKDPSLHFMQVRTIARRMCRDHNLDLIGIDYLSYLMGTKGTGRVQEIESITRNLHIMAEELDVPVLLLAQLNRDCEKRENKRPLLSDLRESGAIEQDSDVVLFLYRDEIYYKDTEDKGVAEVLISKHRNGPTGICKLVFTPQFTRFMDKAFDD